VDQRYHINFFNDEGMKGVEIIDRLSQHYVWNALERTQVYFWTKDLKSWRKDLSNNPLPEEHQLKD
jgi:hypothetical protein